MKRILSLVLSTIIMFSLCACGKNEKAEKYCSSCGEGISKDVAFCEHCGAEVNNEKTESEDTSSDNSSSAESAAEETSKPTTSSKPSSSTSKPSSSTSKPSSSTSKPSTSIHTHSYSKKVSAATCTEKGYTTYTCSCGYSYKDDYTNPTHDYSKYKCTKCGQIDKAYTYEILVDWILENGENSSVGNCCVVELEDTAAIIYHKETNYVYLQNTWFSTYKPANDSTEFFYIQLPEKITNSYYFYGEYKVGDHTLDKLYGNLNPNTFTVDSQLSCDYLISNSNDNNTVLLATKSLYVDIIESVDLMLSGMYEGLTDSGLRIKDLGFTSFISTREY